MQIQESFQQARQWLSQGMLAQSQEMLDSLRREFEQQPPSPRDDLELWKGLLALAQARQDADAVHEAVPRLLQAGRQSFEFDSPQMGALLHEAAQALASIGSGSDAETFFTQAYRRLPEDSASRFGYSYRLAFFYASYGHISHALSWARDAVKHSLELGPEQKMLAQRCMASLLDAEGKSLEALGLRQQIQALTGSTSPWISVDQARSQRRLGAASKAEGHYREALQALPVEERPRIYRELALTALSRRDLAGAEAALVEGLAGADPVSFEAQLLRLEQARLWQFQGRFPECQAVVAEILALWSERFKPQHPLCLKLHEVLIEINILQRDFLQALERCKKRLRLAADAYGSHHPSVARALYWMAQVWSHQGCREEAKQALTQAQMIWDEWNEPCEIERAQVHFGQGLILAEELEFYKAEDEIRKACDIVEQGAGDQSPALGTFLAGLSEVHRVTGRDRQSQEAAQKSQELLRPKR